MPRPNRAKSDAQPKSPDSPRNNLLLSPRKSRRDDDRESLPPSPTSPKTRKAPRKDSFSEPRPATPEGWIELALVKLRQPTPIKVAEGLLVLADLEPDLLEFLITADEEIRYTVSGAVCGSAFPRVREEWQTSMSRILLGRFQVYFNRLPPELADRKVDEAGRQVPFLIAALEALDNIKFDSEQNEPVEEEDNFFKTKTKKSQKQRKAAAENMGRARRNTVTVNPRLFTTIGMQMPTCTADILDVENTLLSCLREVLETLFVAFENPELAVHAKALFFRQPLQFFPTKSTFTTITEAATETNLTSAPNPGAFPHIRPLASAKYFDEGTGLGAWPVVISGRAHGDLRQMQKRDSGGFAMVIKKITELSQGFFSDDNQKRLVGLDTEVPIYEAKAARDMRIVYQIDLDTDVDAKVDKQIIKVYGVYTHAQLDNRMWSLVSHYHINRRGKEYRRRQVDSCAFRTTHRAPGQNVTLPAQFKYEEDMEELIDFSSLEAPSLEGVTEQDFLDLHSLIALEKFIPMSQSLIDSILCDSDANHVFQVSAKEKEIIYHNSACFVLGRSGTGKTTSILFKMIGIEKLYERMKELEKPRQVFVTQSRVLAQRVQEYYESLVKTSSGNLDKDVKSPEEDVLADLDDEDAGVFGLPPKYSMLEDHHFPLFLTYDQLCSLLEADFGLQFRRSARTKVHAAAEKRFAISEIADAKIDLDQEDDADQEDPIEIPTSPVTSTAMDQQRLREAKQAAVTFDVFVAAYWAHFDYQLIKGLDPALVYSEFLGVIEGSETALSSKSGALSRDEYTRISHRKSSFASHKDRVYSLYEAYRKRKQYLGGYDAAERTHALVAATNERIPGQKIDCLYIDEAQDNLLIDIKLLHNLSNNPHGMFLAGDTAQTISAGSAFRFEDLKAFMWRLEEQQDAVRCGKRDAIHPALFHLAVNYRSHGGIVDCASAVVQLISDLFPYSIDKLKKETGLIDGPKPVFFSGWERGVVRFEQFLRGETDTKIDFGASQVILVRNEAARDALRAQVGEIGLILTLYESKGLEFDDVLLYNFFEDSVPSASTWRVILHGLPNVNVGPVPRFDEVRHAVICTELKNLYVGLTRARNHCWIWDVSDQAEPMKTFWTKQNLVTQCGPDDPMPQLGVASSEADWAKSGRLLFNKRLYPQAMFCFEKAGLLVERDIAAAYEARKHARLLQAAKSVDRVTRRTAFSKAAADFLGCAILSKGKQQISCYLRAAECYLQADDWKSAAEAFLPANEFDMAAKNYRRAGCFAEAVDVVKKHRKQIQEKVAAEIYGVARLQYMRTGKYEQATELFDDVEEQLEYMEDYGFDLGRIHVLELHKRYEQAATVAFDERNVVEGVRLLLRSNNQKSVHEAVDRALHGLWTMLPFGPFGSKLENPAIGSLIQHLKNSGSGALGEQENWQVEVFQALYARDPRLTMDLAQSHGKLLAENYQGSSSIRLLLVLLCFSYASRLLTPSRNSTIPEFIDKAKLAFNFLNQLLLFQRTLDLSALGTQRLLGVEPIVEGSQGSESDSREFRIHSTSLLFQKAQGAPDALDTNLSALGLSSLVSSELDARRLATNAICEVLRSEVRTMHNAANLSQYLYPCLDFAIFGRCNRPDCGRQEVNSLTTPDDQRQYYFNLRARALVIQIQTIHLYQAQTHYDEGERKEFRRLWAHRIYELLMPHFPPLGSVICLDRRFVQELDRGAGVLSAWCEEALHVLDPGYGPPNRFLSEVLAYMDIAFRVDRANFATYAPKLHSRRLVKWRDDLLLHTQGLRSIERYSIVHDFIEFYIRRSNDAVQRAIRASHHIVMRRLSIEANVLVHTLEFIGREMIATARRWSRGARGVFDGLLFPRSWALDLVKRPPLLPQQGIVLPDYMATLYKTLELLRAHEPGTSPLYGFNSALALLPRSVLILRICRLLVLVAFNLQFAPAGREQVRLDVVRALRGPGEIHNNLCGRFARADSWNDLWKATIASPLNRGADEWIYLSLPGSIYPPSVSRFKYIYYSTLHELEQHLSFDGSARDPSRGRPSEPKPSAPLAQSQVPTGTSTNEDPVATEPEVEDFAEVASSQDDLLSTMQKPETSRVLTEADIRNGKTILLYYRRYAFRQRIKARWATRIIGIYYSRYQLRFKAPRTATEDRIRTLHNDYKQDIESIDCPLLLVQQYRRHERVLQGYMPHVTVYLRGLEEVNQQQKAVNKKRLQKVEHEELEKVQSRMTACSDISKRLKALTRNTAPGSKALHQIDSLRDQVKLVDDLRKYVVRAFGEDVISADLEQQYRLGVWAILSPPPVKTEPKPQKPELNVSDLMDV